jgi:hypothetical protein
MTKRDINRAIYLSGIGGNYQVHHNIPGQAIACHVPSVRIGNTLVRALRALAIENRKSIPRKPDWLMM